jgi:hypothetical protein
VNNPFSFCYMRSPDKADATVYAFGEIENELSYEWMREI